MMNIPVVNCSHGSILFLILEVTITPAFLAGYAAIYPTRIQRIEQDQYEVATVIQTSNNENSLEAIDFTNQFLKKVHYDAFGGDRPMRRDQLANKDREVTRKGLFDLHDRLMPLIERKRWDLHQHYVFDDTVSSAIHSYSRFQNKRVLQ
jgi:hypothetical protein